MTRANLSKTFFSEIATKMTMKAVTMRNNFEQRKHRQHLHQLKKVRHKGIEDLMNCALIFLFFFLVKIKGILYYTKWDPKNGKKCPAALISCHEISPYMPGILGWNSYAYSYFILAMMSEREINFEFCSKLKLPSKQTW